MEAVILAGGKGTRLRPLTDTRPKPLVPFMGAPFAEGLLRRLHAAGVHAATFLVGADERPFLPLREVGTAVGVEVTVTTEEQPLDTAGAVRRLLRERERGPVLVCNGDILTDLDYAGLVAAHRQAGAVATLALTEVTDTSAFGVVVRDGDGWVQRFVEKPEPGTVADRTVNAGTYVLEPRAVTGIPGDGPLSFEREVFPALLEGGEPVLGVASPAFWADLGTPARYLAGHGAVLGGQCCWPVPEDLVVAAGAAVHDRALVHPHAEIGTGVLVDRDAEVGAGARLHRSVVLGGARIGEGAALRDVIVGAEAVVPAGTDLFGIVIADGEVADG